MSPLPTDSDDSDDPPITSPRKVKQMKTNLVLYRRELNREAEIKKRLREQIQKLCEDAKVPLDAMFLSGNYSHFHD